MIPFEQVLQKYRHTSFSERDKGYRFGRHMQSFLKTYPLYEGQFSSIWLWNEFLIAYIAHRTRLQNILRAPGIDPIEKALLKQRSANLSTARNGYIDKQKKAPEKRAKKEKSRRWQPAHS